MFNDRMLFLLSYGKKKHNWTFEVFNKLMYHCGDPFRRRDAWKMYGSSLIDKKMNMDGAIVAWKKALREVVPPHIEVLFYR